jgi:hypothetical protein
LRGVAAEWRSRHEADIPPLDVDEDDASCGTCERKYGPGRCLVDVERAMSIKVDARMAWLLSAVKSHTDPTRLAMLHIVPIVVAAASSSGSVGLKPITVLVLATLYGPSEEELCCMPCSIDGACRVDSVVLPQRTCVYLADLAFELEAASPNWEIHFVRYLPILDRSGFRVVDTKVWHVNVEPILTKDDIDLRNALAAAKTSLSAASKSGRGRSSGRGRGGRGRGRKRAAVGDDDQEEPDVAPHLVGVGDGDGGVEPDDALLEWEELSRDVDAFDMPDWDQSSGKVCRGDVLVKVGPDGSIIVFPSQLVVASHTILSNGPPRNWIWNSTLRCCVWDRGWQNPFYLNHSGP